jgi:hypothetical protein
MADFCGFIYAYFRVVHLDAALSHHLFEVAQAQVIRQVPPDTEQDHFQRVVETLEDGLERILHPSSLRQRPATLLEQITATEPLSRA